MEHAPPPRTVARRLLEAGVVAGVAFLAVVPYLHYLTRVAFPDTVRRHLGSVPLARVLEADLALLGMLVTICAVTGSLLAERYRLGGLGTPARLRAALPWVLPGGALLAGASYLLFGRYLARLVPGYYPVSLGWALIVALKGPLFDEMVARFGVMTILAGAVRRSWIANLLQAAIFTWLALRGMGFFGVELQWNLLLGGAVLSSLVMHLAHGVIFTRYGLLASSAMHGVTDLKYPVHALLAATGR